MTGIAPQLTQGAFGVAAETVKSGVAKIYTSIPGMVLAYDWETGTATVKQTVDFIDKSGNPIASPTIANVQVHQAVAGGASVTLPVQPGDTGIILFAMRDITAWEMFGGQQEASSARVMSLNDAMFIPGLQPVNADNGATNGTDLLVRMQGTGDARLRLGADGRIALGISDVAELFSVLSDLIAALNTPGNIDVSGSTGTFNPATVVALTTAQTLIDSIKGSY